MQTFAPYLAAFAVVGIIYGSLACLALARQGNGGDLKRLIAYSSVGHMGFVLLGIASLTPTGVNGALFANIAHGLITGLLFFLVGARQGPLRLQRPRHRSPASTGAALYGRPRASAACSPSPPSPPSACRAWPGSGARCWRCSAPSSPAPGLSRAAYLAFTAVAAFGTLLTAAYLLAVVRRVCMGDRDTAAAAPALADVSGYEFAAWTPLAALTVLAGPVARRPARPHRPGRAHPARRQLMSTLAIPRPVRRLGARSPRRGHRRRRSRSSSWSPTCSCPQGRKPLLGWVTVGRPRRWPRSPDPAAATTATAPPSAPSAAAARLLLRRRPLHARRPDCWCWAARCVTALLSVQHPGAELPAGEYWFLLLSSAAGAALLPASRDLATLVVALEVTTLPAFALVGLRRGDRLSSEAALKFFLSSVTATAVIPARHQLRLRAPPAPCTWTPMATASPHADPASLHTLATAGVALTLVGFAFKLAVAPFHFWVPDTYAGAPLPVAALPVGGRQGRRLRRPDPRHGRRLPPVRARVGPAVAVLAALTMTVGNVGALRQRPTPARRGTAAGLVLDRPGGLPAGPDRRRRVRRRPTDADRHHRRLRADVRRREPRRLRASSPSSAAPRRTAASPTTAACTPPARSPPWPWPSSCCAWRDCRPASSGLFAKVAVFSSAVGARPAGSR